MQQLNGEVRMVGIQITLRKKSMIPASLELREQEPAIRPSSQTGVIIMDEHQNMCVDDLPSQIQNPRYLLVDAYYQIRRDVNFDMIYVLKYIFIERPHAEIAYAFYKKQFRIIKELEKLLAQAFWNITVYLNPYYRGGREIPSAHYMSINLNGPNPRYQDGQLRMVWPKNNVGKPDKSGDKVPLKPSDVFFFNASHQIIAS